jgi:TRAP-type C4-dicarboxylate transport system permease small subunit
MVLRMLTLGYEWMNRCVVYFAAVLLIVLTTIVFVGVVVRYLGAFPGSLSWVTELSQLLSIWLAFIGAVVALDRGGHIVVDLLAGAVRGRVRPYYQLFIQVNILVFLVVLTWQGAILTQRTGFEHTPVLHLSLSALYVVVPISGALMGLRVIKAIATMLMSLYRPGPDDTGGAVAVATDAVRIRPIRGSGGSPGPE